MKFVKNQTNQSKRIKITPTQENLNVSRDNMEAVATVLLNSLTVTVNTYYKRNL